MLGWCFPMSEILNLKSLDSKFRSSWREFFLTKRFSVLRSSLRVWSANAANAARQRTVKVCKKPITDDCKRFSNFNNCPVFARLNGVRFQTVSVERYLLGEDTKQRSRLEFQKGLIKSEIVSREHLKQPFRSLGVPYNLRIRWSYGATHFSKILCDFKII